MPVAQTSAEATFAIWNGAKGIAQIPATSGTAERSPKNRPKNMPATPHLLKMASPLGSRSGRRERGQRRAISYL